MILILPPGGRPAGLYVHIPFCERLCPYCDFAVVVRREIPEMDYIEAVLNELKGRAHRLAQRDLRTLYFGGGTPSLLGPDAFARLSQGISREVEGNWLEVTLEANPASVSQEKVEAWVASGVDRVSLGVQSFQDRYLSALGRNHVGEQAIEAIHTLKRGGISRISVDFIVGGPDHEEIEIRADLEVLAKIDAISHVSAYQMTVEPQTAFGRQQRRGTLRVPDDDKTTDLLEFTRGGLAELGFKQYEVSSYAQPGQEGLHNQNYWAGGEYIGIGVGAHSCSISITAERRTNLRKFTEYLIDPLKPDNVEVLDALEHFKERLFLGVRSSVGVNLPRLKPQFPTMAEQPFERANELLAEFECYGWLEADPDGTFRPTHTGFMFSDSMAESFFEVE